MNPPRTAAMCFLRHQDSFLILRRNKAPNQGRLVPVGGKVEPGETPQTAILRELQEEAGIQLHASDLRLCGILCDASPVDYNWIVFVYVANIERIIPPPCPEGELLWLTVEELLASDIPPNNHWVYPRLLSGQFFVFNGEYDAQLRLLGLYDEYNGQRLL